ncbi:MAG: aminotransferase class I/II-fold pyridoxal phosphate-dependent enzyme [Candidatus Eisenbacteria bacterium]
MKKKPGPLPPFRRETARIRPYRVPLPPHRVKLNQNESAVELPLSLKRKIAKALVEAEWSRYPEFPPVRLARAIAERVGLSDRRVLVGHGSNELLYAAGLATLERGTVMVAPTPSYGVAHLVARLAGATVKTVPLGDRFVYEPERFVSALRVTRPRLVFLPSPNNPTGGSLPAGGVEAIAAAARCVVVVDEAYREFSGSRLGPLLGQHRNLVLLRTFSKAYRIAGLRVGYLLGDPEVLSRIERAKPPHSVDLFSQIAAETILGEGEMIAKETGRVVRERERLSKKMEEMPGVEVFPSDANFLLFRAPDGAAAHAALLAEGILVRPVGAGAGRRAGRDRIPVDRRLANCIRVTVGTKSDDDAFLEALNRHLEEKH